MKARLLKVIVQPIVVFDDGETLTEQAVHPLTVPAKDWPKFSSQSLGEVDMERITAQFASKAPPPKSRAGKTVRKEK